MIEILEATKENELYFSTIKLVLNGETIKLKFGVDPIAFLTVKKVLVFRPFSDTGVAPYKYFYARSYRKDLNNPDLAFVGFRVEQLTHHKQFEFQIGKKFLANLRWFEETKDKSLFEKLIVTE